MPDKQEEMTTKARLLGQRILAAREAKGWSQKELGDRVGCSQPAIKDIEDGKTLRSRFIPDIELALGLTAEGKPAQQEGTQSTGDRRLPIFGTRESGGSVLMLSDDIIDAAPMPERLSAVPGAYGIYMSGNCMSPRYREGDLLLIHPHLSPRPGDGVAIFSEDRKLAQIFEFVGSTDSAWVVVRYNDAGGERQLDKARWPKIEVVYGAYSRH